MLFIADKTVLVKKTIALARQYENKNAYAPRGANYSFFIKNSHLFVTKWHCVWDERTLTRQSRKFLRVRLYLVHFLGFLASTHMDHKKRLTAVFIILVFVTYGIWQFGPERGSPQLWMSLRITVFFGVLLLAFDDVKKLLLKLNGPTGILIGIGLLMAVVYKPSAKAILPLLIGCIAILSILGFIRRQFGKD